VVAVAGLGTILDWHVRGSYFEACNCEAICPCRSVGGRPGGPRLSIMSWSACRFVGERGDVVELGDNDHGGATAPNTVMPAR
jgi:hypothetical protein